MLFRKTLVALVAATGIVAAGAGVAHADSRTDAPGCASVTQDGPVVKLQVSGYTAATVRKYVGCGQKYIFTYLESTFVSKHSTYSVRDYFYATNTWTAGDTTGTKGQKFYTSPVVNGTDSSGFSYPYGVGQVSFGACTMWAQIAWDEPQASNAATGGSNGSCTGFAYDVV
jgi:hypothetical protein